MPKALTMGPTIHSHHITTALLGTLVAPITPQDTGKAVKLVGADRYDLCAAGDKVEGVITSVESGYASTSGGNAWGGVLPCTPGALIEVVATVQLAINDKLVAGNQLAKGTALPAVGTAGLQPLPVQKAAADVAAPFLLRVVGFSGGDGAAGTVCVAQFL